MKIWLNILTYFYIKFDISGLSPGLNDISFLIDGKFCRAHAMWKGQGKFLMMFLGVVPQTIRSYHLHCSKGEKNWLGIKDRFGFSEWEDFV